MRRAKLARALATLLAGSIALGAAASPTANPGPSPWNGSWTLDPARSSAGAKEGAADGYRFTLADGTIRWEIPSLGEVVTGRTDGRPMLVRRHGVADGMTLSVTAPDRATLRYRVAHGGKVDGGGVMTLVDGGRAWVDISWGPEGPPEAAELVYVRDVPPSR